MTSKASKTIVIPIDVEKVIEWFRANGAGQNVLRSNVAKISDELLQPGTLKNDDCYQRGPSKRILFNGKISYPIRELAEYAVARGLMIEQSADEVSVNKMCVR